MISGFFVPRFPQPMIRVALYLPEFSPDWKVVRFVVDTGAAMSCVHPVDAIRRLGIAPAELDPATWQSPTVRSAGIGGVARYREADAAFGFRRDDGGWEIIESRVLLGEIRGATQALPSLLGWDVLTRFNLGIDVIQRSIQLDRVR